METPANSYAWSYLHSQGLSCYTLRSTRRSLWSPQQVTQDNCPKGMSLHHCAATQFHQAVAASPLPATGKTSSQTACWSRTCRSSEAQGSLTTPMLPYPCSKPMPHLPCDPGLRQSVKEHEEDRAGKKRDKGRSDSLHSPITSSRRRVAYDAAQGSSTLRARE